MAIRIDREAITLISAADIADLTTKSSTPI